ncbi:1-deoxy-D-xylulose-5-phosphate reductoisomerase [Desulfatirhabdium butyrativorans]|uniref:1-deoxy-D-xylulose-5-phosphate reductoisomerase n=1 Tax=Desulfatirhabdium butyrativorans TaxID=340467 RepID=UPI0004871621|nr:1-deoxy-D-xylulose-5-phosphate reductoisomerase [Desulfatirhabdium butyrativorans]
MKSITILGSTGSIGQNTLRIAHKFPERFRIEALVADTSIDLLAKQIQAFLPGLAVVRDEAHARALREKLPAGCDTEIRFGEAGRIQAATLAGVDTVVAAMVGAAGLPAVMAAIEAGKTIALANKETLVMAGSHVMRAAQERQVSIFPIDSEHSAIFQCLQGNRHSDLDRILLTCSGGPFRTLAASEFAAITPERALCHPNWSMGKKITIDSATLMNKGLELIEAHHLFGVPAERIEVVVHPESIVHSMVAYRDGSVMAQMGVADMKTAIAYSLSYPERLDIGQPIPNFSSIGSLHFEAPDLERFPCLRLAFEAARIGETMPAVMNAANEVAVYAFLERRIGFLDIADRIGRVMADHRVLSHSTLDDVFEADRWARQRTREIL